MFADNHTNKCMKHLLSINQWFRDSIQMSHYPQNSDLRTSCEIFLVLSFYSVDFFSQNTFTNKFNMLMKHK